MKKILLIALTMLLVLCLSGCTEKKSAHTTFTIDDSVTQVEITHSLCGRDSKWKIEGPDVDKLNDWLSHLQCVQMEFEKGKSPGDGIGSEVYHFRFIGGKVSGLSSISCIYVGTDAYYILAGDAWYHIGNPSAPPVKNPEQ